MLEEYLCLGGSEVVNNARAYGYATTSGCPATWFRCAPCESLHDVTTDWTPPTYRIEESRRNVSTNPRLGSASTGYASNGTWATAAARVAETNPGGFLYAWAAASVNATTAAQSIRHNLSNLVVGQAYSVGFWARAAGTGAGEAYARVGINAALNPMPDGSATIPRDGQWRWYGFSVVATSTNHYLGVVYDAGITTPAVAITGVLVVPGNFGVPALSDYFDGSFAETTQNEYRWEGAVDASVSVEDEFVLDVPGHSSELPYTVDTISDAPWYDADFEPSGRFYGVYAISIENLNSSTRTASVTEGILDGGVVGAVRNATREIRVRALLVANGDDALEYGLAWLSAALATTDCETHHGQCGAVDAKFFAYCPVGPDPYAPIGSVDDSIDGELLAPRHLHNVTVTSGPLVEQKLKSSNQLHVGYIVEWTMVAGTPWLYGVTQEVELQPLAPVVVQDVPFNLMPYPSAELASGTVLVQTNYATNPSVEADASGWAAGVNVITPAPTGARSTEVAAQGAASYKVSVTTTNTSTAGSLRAQQVVTLPAESAGQRFSVSMWGFAAVISGTAVLGNLRLVVEWLNGSSTVLRTDNIGTGPVSGGAISGVGLTRPSGAVSARVYMFADVTSWSTGAVLNLFADALAFTSP